MNENKNTEMESIKNDIINLKNKIESITGKVNEMGNLVIFGKKNIPSTDVPIKKIEYPLERIVQNITNEDFNSLKYSEDILEINKTFKFHFQEDSIGIKGHINVGSQKFEVTVPLPQKEKRSFFKEYSNKKSILCNGCITYNPNTDRYFIFNLEIYEVPEPLKKWQEIMRGKTLLQRADTLLSILGLNPNALLYHEKIILIVRLIPLVVKKVLLLELSKKGIGKTHSYQSLGIGIYNTAVTRATAFVDGRNGKSGDFFYEHIAFLIDEIHRIDDQEVITALQMYMNGDKYKGEIQISGNDIRETSVSPIILGNVKENMDLLHLFSENHQKRLRNENLKTLFDKTVIMESADGEAFISRITAIPNSWGCRDFALSMISKGEVNYYNIELLRAIIPVLREKEIDVNSFYEILGITWKCPSIRASQSVEKNFEGFTKLLFPEFIEGISRQEVNKYRDEFMFLYERAVEMRKVVDNQLKIINPSGNKEDTFPPLYPWLKRVMFTINEPCIYTPHRILVKGGNCIKKIPLDTMGIEMNKKEAEILTRYNLTFTLDENNILIHSSEYTRQYFDSRRNFASSGFENIQYSNLFYNYLIGEYEDSRIIQEEVKIIIFNYTFYNII